MSNYLTVDEVCGKLRMAKPTLYSYTRKRKIPHCRIGRRLLFEEGVLDRWVQSKQRHVNSD